MRAPVQHLKRHPVGRILEAGSIQDEHHVFPLAVAADGAEVAVAWNWWYSVVWCGVVCGAGGGVGWQNAPGGGCTAGCDPPEDKQALA